MVWKRESQAGMRWIAAVTLITWLPMVSLGALAQPSGVLGDDASTCDIAAELGIARSDCFPAPAAAGLEEPVFSRGLSIGGPDIPASPATGPDGPGSMAPPAAGAPSADPVPMVQAPAAPRPPASPATPRRAAFRIVFEFGSTRLTRDSQAILDRVGTVLNSPGAEHLRFQIIGHTDAAGSQAFNQILSERRAEAVKTYIVRTHGIAPYRVEAFGKGEDEPLLPADPLAADNRRVEIINLGS